jgi:hypothetical protein
LEFVGWLRVTKLPDLVDFRFLELVLCFAEGASKKCEERGGVKVVSLASFLGHQF